MIVTAYWDKECTREVGVIYRTVKVWVLVKPCSNFPIRLYTNTGQEWVFTRLVNPHQITINLESVSPSPLNIMCEFYWQLIFP